ncbi:hypothetical protein [Sphingomonas sp. PR090111-T3T-6A]|uniref:hypothetical protein n=1 Tax=Sphingomonas sp. PR090111-T3T-6A TaxID=685778 RepID=UPI0003A5A06E|nr:hypothetical protein [Sphingomonas sp. PR090111-T3T-6A]
MKDLIWNLDLGLKTELGFIQSAREAKSLSRRSKPNRPSAEELWRQPELLPMPIPEERKARDRGPLPLDEPILAVQQAPEQRRKHPAA